MCVRRIIYRTTGKMIRKKEINKDENWISPPPSRPAAGVIVENRFSHWYNRLMFNGVQVVEANPLDRAYPWTLIIATS